MPNPNAMTYNAYVTQICTMLVQGYTTTSGVVTPVDTAVQVIIPSMLNYAELRIQKDLDLLASVIANSTYTLSAGANTIPLAVNDFVTVQTISITPSAGTAATALLPTTKEFIQNVYSDSSSIYWATPTYFAVYGGDTAGGNTSNNILVAPYADQTYTLTITGTQWLPSLYATASSTGTGTTYISTNYPDLLVQASMVYGSQYQRNFGPTANDPEMPGAYEAQYQTLLKSAMELENRKKFRDAAWSSQSQSPVATPVR